MHSGVNNVISDDFFISKKAAKRWRKPKSSGPSDFCRMCTCSFAICVGNLGKMSYISAHICREFIPKVLHGVELLNKNEHDAII